MLSRFDRTNGRTYVAGDADERIAEADRQAQEAEALRDMALANANDLREQLDVMADWLSELAGMARSEINTIVAGRRKASRG